MNFGPAVGESYEWNVASVTCGAARIHCIAGPHMQILQRNLPKLQPFLPCLIHYIQYNTQCHFSYTLIQ